MTRFIPFPPRPPAGVLHGLHELQECMMCRGRTCSRMTSSNSRSPSPPSLSHSFPLRVMLRKSASVMCSLGWNGCGTGTSERAGNVYLVCFNGVSWPVFAALLFFVTLPICHSNDHKAPLTSFVMLMTKLVRGEVLQHIAHGNSSSSSVTGEENAKIALISPICPSIQRANYASNSRQHQQERLTSFLMAAQNSWLVSPPDPLLSSTCQCGGTRPPEVRFLCNFRFE
jgi:hypothetical protein